MKNISLNIKIIVPIIILLTVGNTAYTYFVSYKINNLFGFQNLTEDFEMNRNTIPFSN